MVAAFLVAFLSAMVVAYTLVALATINVWRAVPQDASHHGDHPRRVADEATGTKRGRRCPQAARWSPARGRARCPQHRRRC